MEPLNQLLEKQAVKAPGQMNSLTISKMSLATQDEEDRIIQKKYAAKQIRHMNDQELSLWPKALLLKIHVITGWVIPATDLLNILMDQFQKKLIEDYGNLNTEEIEYAFRKSGTIIKDWGKEMNLNLIDQVLIPYLTERVEASRNEEKKKDPPVQKIYTYEEIMNQRRGHVELAFQAMRKGYIPIMHVYFPEVLHMDGFIPRSTDESMSEFFVEQLGKGTENIYVKE